MMPSEIMENLWVGGAPPLGLAVGERFDKLILSAAEYQPDNVLFPNVHVLHAPLQDQEPTAQEAVLAVQAGRAVAGWLRKKKCVLVTCAFGLNRSTLIAAIAMMSTGIPSCEVIKTIREARGPEALHNPYFVALLKRLEDARDFHISNGIL